MPLRYKRPMQGLSIGIVSPALPGVNNGNGRTAERWARLLASRFNVSVLSSWQGEPLDLLIALHAGRSAASVARWAAHRESGGAGCRGALVVVLTGTDLYRDIATEATARRSLALADALVVLQDQGLLALPEALRGKARVIYQSGARRATLEKTTRRLRVLTVGHLRDEKSPQTLQAAAWLLRHRPDICIHHLGAALDPRFATEARNTAMRCPGYSWLGARPHAQTMRWMQRAHVLVHPSKVEGGAHVVLEAVLSGTPVIASDIPGNRGMLGADYDGYVPLGDASALARALERSRDEPQFLARLRRQCARRAHLFEPVREERALSRLVRETLDVQRANLQKKERKSPR